MKISKKGLDIIKAHEGLRLTAYLCPAKVWTIGYGHTRTAKKGMVITAEEAEKLLISDVVSAENTVKVQKLPLNQNQFDALVSFVFNVGSGNFQRSTLLRKAKINVNDLSIASEFKKWIRGGGVVLPGLVKRRNEEAELYFSK